MTFGLLLLLWLMKMEGAGVRCTHRTHGVAQGMPLEKDLAGCTRMRSILATGVVSVYSAIGLVLWGVWHGVSVWMGMGNERRVQERVSEA